MLGIALRYHEYDGCLIAGFALYGLGLAACCVLLHHRRHPLIHRLSPRLLALAHFAAFVWWLTVANNAALAGLWAVLRFPCRVWQVIARCSAFTAYCSCVLARLYIVRSRWLSVDKTRATRTLWCAAAAVVGLCIALITLILLLQSGPRSDCNLNDAQELAYVIYCGVYLIAICVLSVLLGNTVYLDTKADYRVLHPKAYNATIDFLGAALMMISYPLVHVAFAESQEERDNVASTVICLLIPVLLFWMQLAPAVYGRGQALPEMAVSSPNEAFNLNTGTYTSNVEQLPKLRRVLADDNPTARQAVHGFPIPFHDTETLFDLVVSGEVDEVRLFLLDNGVELLNCHARDTGETALHVAITHPDLPADKRGRMIELLVNMKAPLDLCDRDGRTPVHAAAWLKDVQLLCTMLQSAVKSCRFRQSQAHMSQMLNVVAADGSTALHIATKLQDMGSLTALLSLGADPGKSAPPPAGKPGVKPHDWEAACRAAAGDIAHGKSAFLLACEVGSVAMVNQMLLSAPRSCNLEQVSPLGMTPLMTACLFGHDDLARFLMKHGASVWHVSPKAYPNRRMTAVHCCAMGAGASVCCALIEIMIGGSACDFDDDSTSDSEQSYPQAAGDSFPTGDAKATPHACPTVPSTASQASDLTPQRASHPDVGGFDHESSFTEDHKKDALASHTGSLPYHRLHEDSGVLLGEEKQSPIASAASFVADDNSLTSNNDDNDIRAALTVLATRGELKAAPEEQALLDALEVPWEPPLSINDCDPDYSFTSEFRFAPSPYHRGTADRVVHIEGAARFALAAATYSSAPLLQVLSQDHYQWNGTHFLSPLNEPKARHLALEIIREVVNPTLSVHTMHEHEPRLRDQIAAVGNILRQEKLARAVDTLSRAAGGGKRRHRGGGGLAAFPSSAASHPQSSPALALAPSPSARNGDGTIAQVVVALREFELTPLVTRFLDRTDFWGRTALHWAVVQANPGVAFALAACGASLNVKDKKRKQRKDIRGWSLLRYAEHAQGPAHSCLAAIRTAEQHLRRVRGRL